VCPSQSALLDDVYRFFEIHFVRSLVASSLPFWRMLPFGLGSYIDGGTQTLNRLIAKVRPHPSPLI